MLSLIFPFYQLPCDGQQLKGGDMTARQDRRAPQPFPRASWLPIAILPII
jgi:hypothetical protein